MKQKNFLFILMFSISAFVAFSQDARTIAQKVLDQQNVHWNNGDIPAFMETYWKSDDLQFLGAAGYTKGWQATLDNYYKRYPSKQAMGQLTFTLHEVNQRTKKVISLIGQYHLDRTGMDNLDGYFMLILQKIKGKWLIVADSTH